jgi:hypothetical protein
MPDLPISGLPVITVPSSSYLLAVVSGSGDLSNGGVTSQMTIAELGTSLSSVYTPTAYLSAYHTASLFAFVENTPLTMSYSTTDFSYGGVTISGSFKDKIKIDNSGIYNIQFSAQTSKTSGTSTTFYIWLAKNGVEIPSSNTGVTLAGGSNDVAIPAWNFFVSASAGDYYQLMFAVTHNNGVIEYTPSGSAGLTGPAVPSVILTVNRIA